MNASAVLSVALWFISGWDELSVAQFQHAAHAFRQLGRVGDDDEGGALLAVEVEEQGSERVGGGAVERASGFVGEEELGLVDERTDDGAPLALAAGELAGAVVYPLAEADAGEELLGAVHRLCAAGGVTGCERGDKNILQHGALRQQVVRLEDEANLSVAGRGEGEFVEGVEALAVEDEFAGVGQVERADEVEQRALAAAARPDDGDGLAARDFEREAAQHGQVAARRAGVALGDVREAEQGSGRGHG